ncbi:MAG TPA: hypothetical protein DCE41_04050 [Cytophagales bacterium]|nr:hypothetical protein [Cytophagales bacterium]HAA20816.1 hypothetical protein [Cytophagales bacterium]HAP59104.1 hypothetical protein [Cytophagales bacterium]
MKRRVTIIVLVLAMLAPEAFAREYSKLDSLKSVLTEVSDYKELARINYLIASELYGSPIEALPYITDALSNSEKSGNTQWIATSAYVFGLINDRLVNTKDAFLGYHKGLNAYTELGVIEYAAECHLGLGRLYLVGHQSDKAKVHFDQAGALLVNDKGDARGGFYAELGDLYFDQEDFVSALSYYQLALEHYETPLQLVNAEVKLGNAHLELEQYDDALLAYTRSENQLVGVEGEDHYQSMIEFNRGLILQRLGDHVAALAKFERANELEDDSYVSSAQWTINNMAKSHIALGDYDAAGQLLAQSIEMGKDEYGSVAPFLLSFELAIQVAESTGDLSSAFAYQQDYQSHLVSEQRIETEVSDAKAVLEIQMAENEILTAQLAAAERVKLWAVSIAGALGVVVLVMLLIRFINRNKRLQAKFNRKQAAIKELKRMTVSEEW